MARARNRFSDEPREQRVAGPTFIYQHPPRPPDRGVKWDFRDGAPLGLAKEFAKRLGPIAPDVFRGRTRQTVEGYKGAYRALGKRLLSQGRDIQTLRDLTPGDLAALDLPGRYSMYRCLPTMFRWFKEADPNCLSPSFAKRMRQKSKNKSGKPREPLPDDIHNALQEGADLHLSKARDRIFEGRKFRDNLLGKEVIWRIDRIFLDIIEGNAISDRDSEYFSRYNDSGYTYRDLRYMLHLSADDAAAATIALATRVKVPLEGIKLLKRDCLIRAAGGSVHVRYDKTRAGKILSEKCRDGGINTPGGIIRLTLDLTEHAAARLRATGSVEGEYLLVGFSQTSSPSIKLFKMGTPNLNKAVKSWNIKDSSGMQITKAEAVRIRKNSKATEYRDARGHIRVFASDNSPKVAGFHYAALQAFDEDHKRTIEAAQADLIASTEAPHVLSCDHEAEVRMGNVANIGTPSGFLDASKLDGDFDTFLGVCLDFWNSPMGQESDGSCGSGFTACLHCRNALFHRRKLPALIAYNRYILSKRTIMSVKAWKDNFGLDWARINIQIFPKFRPEDLDEAALIAASEPPLLPIPSHAERA